MRPLVWDSDLSFHPHEQMRTLFINGKFAAQRITGVQRLAIGLVTALDRLLLETDSPDRWVLLCPPQSTPPRLGKIEVQSLGPRWGGLHGWEQGFLPLYTRGETLLNLAGPAPLLKRKQVCMIPDAAVFDHPQAYTRAFGTWYRLLFRTVARSAKLLLTISDFSKQRLALALGISATELRVVHCAASHMRDINPDTSIIERLGLTQTPYMLAVGSLNPTKNLAALVAAFRALSGDMRLVLVGGSNGAVFANHSTTIGFDRRVMCTGALDDRQLSALYAGALAFIFPSLYEGFGLPPLEAMSLGCPVVASSAASIPETCGDAALYFDPNSIAEMTQSMARIGTDAMLRDRLRQRGAQRIQQFTWANSAMQLLSHLSQAGLVSSRPV